MMNYSAMEIWPAGRRFVYMSAFLGKHNTRKPNTKYFSFRRKKLGVLSAWIPKARVEKRLQNGT